MPPYLPIRALNRSAAVRIGKQKISATATSYVDIGATVTQGQSVAKEIAYHSSIGQIYAVGVLTASNADIVVATGATTSAANLVITVAAGELRVRSTGAYVAVAGGTTTLATADGTNPRFDIVYVDNVTGAQANVTGTPAAVPVAPAVPAGKTPLTQYSVLATATAATSPVDLRPRP